LNVDGHRIKLPSSEDFLNQNRFTKICVDSYNLLPNRVNDGTWRVLIRTLLDKVEEVPAPEDAGSQGEFMSLVERFCTERAGGRTAEEMLTGRPYTADGRTFFRAIDLLEWMRKKKFAVSSRDAWDALRERGAKSKPFKIKGKFFRAWSIPAFSSQEEPFEVPKIEDGGF
jgi:hypothetical protein